MQDASEQQPQTKNSAGYRPLIPAELTRRAFSPAYAYVTATAGVGLLAGLVIAIGASYGKITAGPGISNAQSLHASGLKNLPAAYAGPAPSLLNQVDPGKKAAAGTPQLTLVSEKSSKTAGRHKKHGDKLWTLKKGGLKGTAKRMPYVSPNAPASSDGPTALDQAMAAANSGPFLLVIQGEVTVAGYDEGSGTIETYEGQTFVLDKTVGDTSAIRWPDFPFNVHYRCDGAGSCTLMRGGATAEAKLAR
jgi:hypothetical protein